MNNKKITMFLKYFCLIICSFFINILTIDVYLKYKIDADSELPVFSMYEIINKPIRHFVKERDVSLPAYFGKDKRLYVSVDEARIKNRYVSFPVQYSDSMEKCIGSYVMVEAKVKYDPNTDDIAFYEFKRFSKIVIGESRSIEQDLAIINNKFYC